MIYLGNNNNKKIEIINSYSKKNNIKKIIILSPEKFYFNNKYEYIEWNEIIQYRVYYRLLKDIDSDTLIVVNECLRKKNRYELTYNCIRLFLNQTKHKIIFQYLPIINNRDDFMILFDFDTRSNWKRESFNIDLINKINCNVIQKNITLNKIEIQVSNKLKTKYDKKKKELFDHIGLKNPHTIPRNLYLLSGKEKLKYINQDDWYVGRNNRFKIDNFQTFREDKYIHIYKVFEVCHNFINFTDFLFLSGQTNIDVFVSTLKVDLWYWDYYNNWIKELNYVYSIL